MGNQPPGFIESLILFVMLIMLLISVQLFRAKGGIKLSNRLLGGLFLLLSFQIFLSYLTVTGTLTKPLFRIIDDTLLLGVGPALWLYATIAIGKRTKLVMSDLAHFVPLIFLLIPFLFFLVISNDYSEWLLGFDLTEVLAVMSQSDFQITSFLMLTHINVYLLCAFVITVRSNGKLPKSGNYGWVIYTLVSFQIINLVTYLQVFRSYTFLKAYPSIPFLLILITLILFLISILLKGMDGRPLFSESQNKYKKSKLGLEQKQAIQNRLEELINVEKLYLDAEVSVKSLAELLETHPKNVSQVINEIFGKSFYDLINHNRVDHAIDLISNSDNAFTISEIQYKSGFNSKSSFNSQFRKKTGLSPREYKAKLFPTEE